MAYIQSTGGQIQSESNSRNYLNVRGSNFPGIRVWRNFDPDSEQPMFLIVNKQHSTVDFMIFDSVAFASEWFAENFDRRCHSAYRVTATGVSSVIAENMP